MKKYFLMTPLTGMLYFSSCSSCVDQKANLEKFKKDSVTAVQRLDSLIKKGKEIQKNDTLTPARDTIKPG